MPRSFPELPWQCGSYELVRHLGTGGLASVYLARRRERPEGWHVLRLVQPMLRDCRRFHEQLVLEARSLAQLDHSCVVRVEEIGDQDGVPYVVLEYVPGVSLRRLQHWVRGPFLPHIALHVIDRVLEGLAAAHAHEPPVLHGDLSSSNVLVGVQGQIKLTDFCAAQPSALPQAEWGLNTAYASPEAVLGEPPSVRSDLFSVGVMLWELLYGARYYAALGGPALRPPTPDEVVAAARPPILPIAGMRGLDALFASALAGFPRQRFEDAPEFRQALGQCSLQAASASIEAPFGDWLCSLGIRDLVAAEAQ